MLTSGVTIYGLVGASQQLGGTAVPEPGTWLLLLVGFGLTGAMRRRRTLGVA